MRRDWELIRKLLIYFEDKPGPDMVKIPPIPGYDEPIIQYHLVLLYEAGTLQCEVVKSKTSDRVIYVIPFELTWNGHEFLEKIRNQYIWDDIFQKIQEKGLKSASIGLIQQLADFAIRKKLGI